MECERRALANETVNDDSRQAADHLGKHHCGRMQVRRPCFYKDGSLRRRVSTDDDSYAPCEGHPVLNLQLVDEDDRYANEAQADREHLLYGNALIRQIKPREEQTE